MNILGRVLHETSFHNIINNFLTSIPINRQIKLIVDRTKTKVIDVTTKYVHVSQLICFANNGATRFTKRSINRGFLMEGK